MPPNIMIRVGADTDEAERKLGGLGKPLDDVQSRGARMGDAIHKATLPAIAVLGGLAIAAKGAAQAAAEDQAGQEALAAALQRTTGATAQTSKGVEDWIAKLSLATGTADDELRPAMEKLASATGSVKEAEAQTTLALDIAAASHKSLATVTKALASADDGHTASLAKLVPGLDAATLKSGNMAKITADLADKVGGAASTAANTATGRYRIMQVQLGELQESIGTALIPVISALSSAMLKATSIASEHTTAIKVVAAAVAALAAGVLLANAAIKAFEAAQIAIRAVTAAWTAGQWLLNAALTANPIGIVIAAVAGLSAGIVLAYQHSATFRSGVQAVWTVLQQLNPVNAARAAVAELGGAVSAAAGFFSSLYSRVDAALGAVGGIRGALSTLWTVLGYTNPIAAAIQHFQSLAGAVESVVGWISRIHFPSPPSWLGKIGGLLGAVAPTGASSAAAVTAGPRGASSAARSSGSPRGLSSLGPLSAMAQGVTVNVFGATDPEGTARAIRRVLRAHDRRQGGLSSIVTAPA